jgi:hypothetical protein
MRADISDKLQPGLFEEITVAPGNWYEERLALAKRGKVSIWCPKSCFDCRSEICFPLDQKLSAAGLKRVKK